MPFIILGAIIGIIWFLINHKKKDNKKPKFSVSIESDSIEEDYSRYFQKWDESFDKDLGYEWFRICIERKAFPIYNSFATRLSNVRSAKKLTQITVASAIGISPSSLSSYENGNRYPSVNIVKLLSEYYDVPIDFLIHGYVNSLEKQIELSDSYNESEYIHSLCLSVRAANRMFPDILTEEDKQICRQINDYFKLEADLFGEKAAARAEEKAKQDELINKISIELLTALKESDILQSEFIKQHQGNENLVKKAISNLLSSGKIEKNKQGSSFLLHIIDQ